MDDRPAAAAEPVADDVAGLGVSRPAAGDSDAHADLAEVLALADRPQEAVGALEQALARYERKENIVMAERVRARLTSLRSSFVPAKRA